MWGTVFRRRGVGLLFASATVSETGNRVTGLVLPVLAATVLSASPWQMGVLQACAMGAWVVVGLPAGALVDRWRPRRVMVVCDLLRAALLVSVPLVSWTGGLSLAQLFVVAFALGLATVFADVAYQSVLPGLVPAAELVDANSVLLAGTSAAEVAGPGVGGALLRVVAAPMALLADVASFLGSALLLCGVPSPTRPIRGADRVRSLRAEIGEGLRFVLGHPVLRRIVICTGVTNAASGLRMALLVLFALRELGLSASALGLVLSIGAVGGIAGAAALGVLSRMVGRARVIPLSALGFAPFAALTPLATLGAPAVWLAVSTGGLAFVSVAYNVSQLSLRQMACPPELLGRMNASVRTIVLGTPPLGALAGGLLAGWWGFGPVLWLAVGAMAAAAIPVVLSPLWRDKVPEPLPS
jgi:MFS family permease